MVDFTINSFLLENCISNLLNISVENAWDLFEFKTISMLSNEIHAQLPNGTKDLPNFWKTFFFIFFIKTFFLIELSVDEILLPKLKFILDEKSVILS